MMAKRQVGALPYRIRKGGVEILLVTTRGKKRWFIPKGWPMKGRKLRAAAAIEAFEEAGVKGRIRRRAIGDFAHEKRIDGRNVACEITLYPLAVKRNLKKWPERSERKRQWFKGRKAIRKVTAKGVRRAITRLTRKHAD